MIRGRQVRDEAIPSWKAVSHGSWSGGIMQRNAPSSYRTSPLVAMARRGLAVVLCASLGVLSALPAFADGPAIGSSPAAGGFVNGYWHHQGGHGESDVNVCSYAVGPGVAHCNAQVRNDFGSSALASAPSQPAVGPCSTSDNNVPSIVSGTGTGAYDPCYLKSAYNVASAAAAHGGGAGQIVAIVDAYGDPNVTSDLAAYRSFFGLSACPTGTVSHGSSTCTFQVVNEFGSSSPLPPGNTGWGEEISLDVQMVSAICPNCQILLVEASTASIVDLGTAVNEAASMGANVVSNSYGGSEYNGEQTDSNTYFNHPGVAVVVASGDSGYGTEFPAASPTVTAVGGTSLSQFSDAGTRSANALETVWSGAGAGCSAYEPKPSWQTDLSCTRRMVTDVSAVADPNTGVWVYDTYGTGFTWAAFGGTSVATPIISSMYALAGNASGGSTVPASAAYANPGSLYHVTSGTDGSCAVAYMCNAAASVNGYNGPTGLGTPGGSPNSLAAFSTAPVAPTAPGPPTSLTATATNGAVALSWSAPSSNGGSPILGYNVYQGTSPGAESATALNGVTPINATTYSVSGLTNGTTYYFTVASVNAYGSTTSTEASATPVSLGVPGSPTLKSATANSSSVTLAWGAPSSNGGSAILGYNVFVGTAPGAESSAPVNSLLITGNGATVNGLLSGTKYYFTVRAVNVVGSSTSSNELSSTPGLPGSPTLTSAVAGTGSVTLGWTQPSSGGSRLQGYNVYVGTSPGGESAAPVNSSLITRTRVTVTGLTKGTTYYFFVRAVNRSGAGAPSNELSVTSL
jgi:hypothetical protein